MSLTQSYSSFFYDTPEIWGWWGNTKTSDGNQHIFFSPFETGVRFYSGWRWYHKFLRDHPAMCRKVEHDCFIALRLVAC